MKLLDVKQISNLASWKWMQIFDAALWILLDDFSLGIIFIWFTRHIHFLLATCPMGTRGSFPGSKAAGT
jgi:hypothetical protein